MSDDSESVPLIDIDADVEQYWQTSITTNSSLTPFHSREWLTAWAESYDATDRAEVWISRSSEGTINGLLPMMSTDPGGWRSLSTNATDYTGLIWQPDPDIDLGTLARKVRSQSVSPCMLWNVRHDDPLVAYLNNSGALIVSDQTPTRLIDLEHAAYRPERGSGLLTQKEVDRRAQQLRDRGVTLGFQDTLDDAMVDQMVAVHTRRWVERGQAGNFADPRRVILLRMLQHMPLKILVATLSASGQIIAYRLGFLMHGTFFDWNTSFDVGWRRTSPGAILLNLLIDELSVRGISRFDFLRGSEPYKEAWSTTSSFVYEYQVRPNGI